MTVAIRNERPGDEADIAQVIAAAFETAPHRSGTETQIVEPLLADGAPIESSSGIAPSLPRV